MGAVRVTCGRTVGRARGLFSTAFALGCFLAVTALLFMRGMESGEGGQLSFSVMWALGVAPVLPLLAAVLGMDVWSDERLSGRLDALLTVAVRERDYVMGKFLGTYILLLASLGLSLAIHLSLLMAMAPEALARVSVVTLAMAFVSLALQGVLWTAFSVMASAMFRHAASAAVATVLALAVFPRGLWLGLQAWSEAGRTAYGEFPLDAQVVDIASGLVPLGTVGLYIVLAGVCMLLASKFVMSVRLVGRGAARLRLSTAVVVVLAVVFAVLSGHLLIRVNPAIDIPVAGERFVLSPRTRSILSETSGTLTITSFMSRNDPAARSVGRLLRSVRRTCESLGGAHVELRTVDPRWDLGAAERLVRQGVSERSLVFEQGRRIVSVSLSEGIGERLFAATIRRIAAPPHRRNIYWTTGHGEIRPDDYSAFGMSDIARDLFREGYGHVTVDLSGDRAIPDDCALIVIAGARDDFSRSETARLNAYLHDGGRMLLLLRSSKTGGVTSLLPSWGMRPFDRLSEKAPTMSGTDVIVTDFAEHPISSPLRGSRILLDRPVCFAPSSVAESGAGVDRIGYAAIAEVGSEAVVAAIEQGGGVGTDLALRPTRIVAVGDAGFVLNGQLTARACANRDFFLNCVAYLAGAEAHGSGDEETGAFRSGLDREGRLRLAVWAVLIVPASVFIILLAHVIRRRRRS